MGWKTEKKKKSNWEKNLTSKGATPAAHPSKKPMIGTRGSWYSNHLWKGNLGGTDSLHLKHDPSTNSPQPQFPEFPFFKGTWAERNAVTDNQKLNKNKLNKNSLKLKKNNNPKLNMPEKEQKNNENLNTSEEEQRSWSKVKATYPQMHQ